MLGRYRGGGGGITIPPRRVTFWDTVKEILFFALLYSLAGIAQLAIVCAVALLLGTLSGAAFLLLVFLLEFKVRILADVRPARIGVYFEHAYHNREKPGHIAFVQAVLGIAGAVAIALVVTDYFPVVWQWRIGWDGEGYIILSRFAFDDAGQWYIASTIEILARIILIFAVPFVGWVSTLVVKWAAYMEATRPTARETTHGVVDPGTLRGPQGEEYRGQKRDSRDDGGAAIVIPPDYD